MAPRFRYAIGTDADAVFEMWFANQPPAVEYDLVDGGYVVVCLYMPNGRTAIGSILARSIIIAGRAWSVWLGQRNNAPVISYVPDAAGIAEGSLDLAPFVLDAVARTPGISTSMFLTDVHGGFEIWSGGVGLSLTNFSIGVE